MKIDSGSRIPQLPEWPELPSAEEVQRKSVGGSFSAELEALSTAEEIGASASASPGPDLTALRAKLAAIDPTVCDTQDQAVQLVVESALEAHRALNELSPEQRQDLREALVEFLDADPDMKQRIQRVVARVVQET
ncbi:MAG: hypothetical protein HYV63_31285 [Candidatus Schekmanbacteria bacterium]|nr:hypothetical protein [Candidatus Schekmanbacteria bacterium]